MMSPMQKNETKFAFFGTPHLATVFLDELEKGGFVPSLVVTTPDKPRGRGLEVSSPPVKDWAVARRVAVLQPEELHSNILENVGMSDYDVFVVIYYGKILPPELLSIPKHGTLNIHFSLLPRWRGTSPVRAAIANDDREIGTSIIRMDEKIDHGPIIAQKKILIASWPPKASETELVATHASARLLADILPSYIAGDIEARKQNHDVATMCPKYEKEDGHLDLSADPYKNLLKIRAFDSTVGTHSFFERKGKQVRVQILDAHLDPSTSLRASKLVIDMVKPEGKRDMPYEEFLRSGAKPA